MSASELSAVMRPFLWLALAAFVAGFASYVALGRGRAPAGTAVQAAVYAPIASAPSSDAWNRPKRI